MASLLSALGRWARSCRDLGFLAEGKERLLLTGILPRPVRSQPAGIAIAQWLD